MVLALGRSDPLKNLPLTLAAWRRLPEPRPELCLFGSRARARARARASATSPPRPTRRSTSCFNQATVFLQTSTHEGFCLPVLESMATGGAVVCTDAHGNRDFCVDGVNCLMPEASPPRSPPRSGALLGDPDAARARSGEAGMPRPPAAGSMHSGFMPGSHALEACLCRSTVARLPETRLATDPRRRAARSG